LLAARQEGQRLKDLAERLGVSKLTVQRDIDHLSRAGVPVEESSVGNTNLYFVRAAPPVPLDAGRKAVLALDAARAALSPLGPSGLRADFERVAAEALRSPAFKDRGIKARQVPPTSVMDSLLEAILDSRRFRIRYRPRGADDDREYIVEPYWFRAFDGLMYLEGRVPPHKRQVTFAAHLIRDVVLLDEAFKRPVRDRRTGFGVFDGKPERVEVVFDADIAPFIAERQWHPSQKLSWKPDGSLVFTARLSGMEEFVGWVMSWGHRAELKAPAAWRREVVQRLRGMNETYQEASSRGLPEEDRR
jgi:predicted DNA-binding transcriptional regulator YafY